NVYFSVAKRSRYEDTEKFVKEVPGLWVDIDPKHKTMEKVIQMLTKLPTPPSAIVSSSNGIHAYFKFDEVFRITNEDSLERIKALSVRLHKFLNVGHTADLVRMLRLSASWNVEQISQLKFCEVIECTDARYSINDFAYLSDVGLSNLITKFEKVTIDYLETISLDDLKLPTHIKQLIVEGTKKGYRSQRVFQVTWLMLENGHSPNEVAFVLTNPEWDISEKILELPYHRQLPYIELAVNRVLQCFAIGADDIDDEGNEENIIEI
ncbi:hypothetical protein V7068_20545, partial [Bacillus sp. JJ634]